MVMFHVPISFQGLPPLKLTAVESLNSGFGLVGAVRLATSLDPVVCKIKVRRRIRTESSGKPGRALDRIIVESQPSCVVGLASDFNLPEYFSKRRGGSMDLRRISSKANPPHLVDRISQMFPSFRQEWMDDRTRSLAVRYVLKTQHRFHAGPPRRSGFRGAR